MSPRRLSLGARTPSFLNANKIWKITYSDFDTLIRYEKTAVGFFHSLHFLLAGATTSGTANKRLIDVHMIGNTMAASTSDGYSASHISLYQRTSDESFYISVGAIYYYMLPYSANCDYTLESISEVPSDATEVTIS